MFASAALFLQEARSAVASMRESRSRRRRIFPLTAKNAGKALIALITCAIVIGCGSGGYFCGITSLSGTSFVIDAGQSLPVTATGFGNPDINWSIAGPACSGSACGTISNQTGTNVTYVAPSGITTPLQVVLTATVAQTKNQSAAEVAELLLGEVSRLATAPVPDIELNPRKAVVVGNFARNLETNAGLVAQVATLAVYGISFDEINRYIGNVQNIAAGDVQRFAGAHLDAKATNIVIVGNAKEFLPELRKKYTQVEVIPMAELDLNTALLRKKQQS